MHALAPVRRDGGLSRRRERGIESCSAPARDGATADDRSEKDERGKRRRFFRARAVVTVWQTGARETPERQPLLLLVALPHRRLAGEPDSSLAVDVGHLDEDFVAFLDLVGRDLHTVFRDLGDVKQSFDAG